MMFRTISTAIMAGLVAGLCLFLVQRWTVLPLIRAAETYERARSVPSGPHSDSAFEKEPMRSVSTLLGDMFVAIGFGLILTGIYALSGKYGWFYGLLWGAAGFATFQLGPALVVAPAAPGMEVAALLLRQTGWLVAACSTGIGLALMVIFKGATRLIGVPFLLLPAVVFRGLLPIASATTSLPPLAALDHLFMVRALGSALLFWIVLGTISGYLFAKAENAAAAAHGFGG
ncbi:MAG TPA: CbtA family protein [Candidatus Binataceae bacterium]|nr:CbtA family protein [Candidatus Binataceae bacterium]